MALILTFSPREKEPLSRTMRRTSPSILSRGRDASRKCRSSEGSLLTGCQPSPGLIQSPVSQHAMARYRGGMSARCLHQLAEMQRSEGALDCTFGQAGFICQHAQAGFDWSPTSASGAPGKIKIDEECRRLLIVSDDIAHQHIEDVIIDRHGSMEARHIASCMLYR